MAIHLNRRLPPAAEIILAEKTMEQNNSSQIAAFWDWFLYAAARYESLFSETSSMDPHADELMDDLEEHLHAYNDNIWFRMGGPGPYELIITAEGNTAEFEAIQKLVNAAPDIPGWKAVAFIQPTDISNAAYRHGDIELNSSDIFFGAMLDPRRKNGFFIEVMFYVSDAKYTDDDEFKSAVIRIAESGVGEFNFNTLVGFHDVLPLSRKSEFNEGKVRPITELSKIVGDLDSILNQNGSLH